MEMFDPCPGYLSFEIFHGKSLRISGARGLWGGACPGMPVPGWDLAAVGHICMEEGHRDGQILATACPRSRPITDPGEFPISTYLLKYLLKFQGNFLSPEIRENLGGGGLIKLSNVLGVISHTPTFICIEVSPSGFQHFQQAAGRFEGYQELGMSIPDGTG